MKKHICCFSLFFITAATSIQAQRKTTVAEVKQYHGQRAGSVRINESRVELYSGEMSLVYDITVPGAGIYQLQAVAAPQGNAVVGITVDKVSMGTLETSRAGFQLTRGFFETAKGLSLSAGRHEIRFIGKAGIAPLITDISLTPDGYDPALEKAWTTAAKQIELLAAKPIVAQTGTIDKTGAAFRPDAVLANPVGSYTHDVESPFYYTTVQYVYLTAGNVAVYHTQGSTVDPVITLFDPNNIDNASWANDDALGMGVESRLEVIAPYSGYYLLVVRPYHTGTGTTNLYSNGTLLNANTPIGGSRYYSNGVIGMQNFFTCQLTAGAGGVYPDTRLFVMEYPSTPVLGYNDDYSTNGDWAWGLSSRINKYFTKAPNYVYTCAYSLTRYGNCDTYMGAANSSAFSSFANLKADDAIRSGDASLSYYNCISWSGGITTAWHWPIDYYSVYYNANPLTAFDNFYSNYPVKRYSGAWNYTRNGANVSNAVVDLWAYNGSFTHGSVRKPGNAHPHGYDWESKPGSLDRTFHPRYALNGAAPANYGTPVNYYIFAGSYANKPSGQGGFTTDLEAIAAGTDAPDRAVLSAAAMDKLHRLTGSVSSEEITVFNKLFAAWKDTWQQNLVQSDARRYCQNDEYEALLRYCKNNVTLLPLVFDQYIQGNAICNPLLADLTSEKYGRLLEEVKAEFIAQPYDKQGRFIVNNPHSNGIRHIEKILQELSVGGSVVPSPKTAPVVQLSPNPVKDRLVVQVTLTEKSTVQVQVLNSQTGATLLLQKAADFTAGEVRFSGSITALKAVPGSLLTVNVTVNGTVYTHKLISGQ